MKRGLDRLDLLSFAFIGAAALGTLAVFDRLPDPMPVHFDAHGRANGWMPRAAGAFVLPALTLATWLLVRFGATLLAGSEEREKLEGSPLSMVGLVLCMSFAGLQAFMIHAALRPGQQLADGVWSLLGGMFLLLGLLMRRVQRNRWIGVRTPWTLASDDNWERTHRFASYTMTLSGAAAVVMAMAGVPLVGVGVTVLGTMAPIVYSWRLSKEA